MSGIPIRYDVVVRLKDAGYFAKAETGDQKAASLFARLCAYEMNPTGAADSFGWLTKQPGETQVDGYAEDAIVYGSTPSDLSNVIDLVTGAGAPGASIAWQAGKPRRPSNTWERPRALTAAELNYLKAGSGGNTGGGGGTQQPVCQYQATDLGPVLARLDALEATVQAMTDAATGAEVAAQLARAELRELVQMLQMPGLHVDASARIVGPIRGTLRLPSGGAS